MYDINVVGFVVQFNRYQYMKGMHQGTTTWMVQIGVQQMNNNVF
jgi:hypothetical protein